MKELSLVYAARLSKQGMTMDVLYAAEAAVKEAVPEVVLRHRSLGALTWRLLHQIEAEVVSSVVAAGKHNKRIVGMMQAPEALAYPKDDLPVSFDGHDFVPIIFAAIHDAWHRLH